MSNDSSKPDLSTPSSTSVLTPTPIRLALLPDREWEAVLETQGCTFSYRDPSLTSAYIRAQKWAPGPTRPFLSDEVDAVLRNLASALGAFDELVETLVCEGLRETELKFVLHVPYLEDLMLRVLFGIMRSAINERASPDE